LRATRVSILVAAAVGVLTLSILPVSAQDSQSGATLGALPEVEFSQLSQRDPNPLGEKALAIHADQWKHAETEHFIYHFVHSYVAAPVSVEAEFHYRVVAKELEREQPAGDTKSHIYIFERPEEWQQFQAFGKLEPWTGGIHSQGSLFIQRNPAYKFSSNLLGHEIADTPVTSAPAVTSPSRIHRRSRRKTLFPSPHSSPSLIRLPIA
jgi:hypothetical protein